MEFATDPPLRITGFRAPTLPRRARWSSASTNLIVPFSNPSPLNSASEISEKISTIPLHTPNTSSDFMANFPLICTRRSVWHKYTWGARGHSPFHHPKSNRLGGKVHLPPQRRDAVPHRLFPLILWRQRPVYHPYRSGGALTSGHLKSTTPRSAPSVSFSGIPRRGRDSSPLDRGR